MVYQINSSKLFCTYAQCPIKKEEALQLFFAKFDVLHYLIAEELHKNGDPHLHVYLELKEAFRTRDCTFADLGAYHGNYQGCRSEKNVLKYCSKDEDFISDLDVASILKKRESHKKLIGSRIVLNNEPLETLVHEFPELIFGYKRLKEDILEFRRDAIKDTRDDLPDYVPNTWGKLLPVDLDNKKCHYWVWSSVPNRGKTTFALKLLEMFKGILKSTDFSYWNIRPDTELIIFDEFNRGSIKAQQLNSLCDGTYEFRVFQGGLVKLNIGKPLIIVLSNFNIETVFPYMHTIVSTRFTELCVD